MSGKRNSTFLVLPAILCGGLLIVVGCDNEPEPVDVLLSDMEPLPSAEKAKPAAPAAETAPAPKRPVASEKGPWPTATTTKLVYQFGRMSIGTELEHVFKIGNDGDADLELLPGKATCKCTEFSISPTVVKPGESAELHIRWKGKNKDSTFQHGGPVYTNDPEREILRFAVKGIVDANLEVLPVETWSAGEVKEGVPGTGQGIIMSRVHEDFEITDITCDSPLVSFEAAPATKNELEMHDAICAYKVKVSVADSIPPGAFEAKLTVKASCEKKPLILTVTANKLGPIRVLPWPGVHWTQSTGVLRLGQFSSQKGRDASLILLAEEAEGADTLEFTDIEAKPSYLKADLERVGSAGKGRARYKMTVKIPPGVPRTERTPDNPGLLNIKTNHPSGQSLRLKIVYTTQF